MHLEISNKRKTALLFGLLFGLMLVFCNKAFAYPDTPFTENFDTLPAWANVSNVTYENGRIKLSDGAAVVFGDANWDNYSFEANMEFESIQTSATFYIRNTSKSAYSVSISNSNIKIIYNTWDWATYNILTTKDYSLEMNKKYNFRIVCVDAKIIIYIDGVKVAEAQDTANRAQKGKIYIYITKAVMYIDDIKVASCDMPIESFQVAGVERVEIPETGTVEKEYALVRRDQYNMISPITNYNLDIDGDNLGCSILNNKTLKIPSAATKGNLRLKATHNSTVVEKTIILSGATSISFTQGYDVISIPDADETPTTVTYIATVKDQNNVDMSNYEITYEKSGDWPLGISLNGNVITVQPDSEVQQNTEIVLKATSGNLSVEKTIALQPRLPNSIEITGTSQVIIPDVNNSVHTFVAKVKDKNDNEMKKETVSWTVYKKGTNETPTGVVLSNQGVLTVYSTAIPIKIEVVATSSTVHTVIQKKEVEIGYNDSICVRNDTNSLQLAIDKNNVIKDFVLPTNGENSTKISWAVEKEIIIKDKFYNLVKVLEIENARSNITRSVEEDVKVKIIATISKGTNSDNKEFVLNIPKVVELIDGSSFETEEDMSFWELTGTAVKSQNAQYKYSGSNSLEISNSTNIENCIYQKIAAANNKTYVVSGHFNSMSGTTITIQTENGIFAKKEIGKNKWEEICGDYTFKGMDKATDLFNLMFTNSDGSSFYADDITVIDITESLNELIGLIANAEISKLQTDKNDAQTKLNEFLPNIKLPRKLSLQKRIDNIVVSRTNPDSFVTKEYATMPNVNEIPIPKLPTAPKFNDIDNHWAKEDILALSQKGIVNGVGENKFMPDNSITRAEFITLIIRAINCKIVKYQDVFNDVPSYDWYADFVMTALDKKIISSDESFRPNHFITREEMSKIIIKAYELFKNESIDLTNENMNFIDNADISDWAIEYVQKASGLSIIKGMENQYFYPKNKLTRAEAVTVLKRLMSEV